MKLEEKFKYYNSVMSGNKIWPNSLCFRRVEELYNEIVSFVVTICDEIKLSWCTLSI